LEEILERTLVLVKPDGVQRGLIGQIITRLEQRGLKMVGIKLTWVSLELAEKHYAIHKGKPFYDNLIRFITSSPVVAMVWEGVGAVALVRQTMGATKPSEAAPGTIRHDFAVEMRSNLTHGSDSPENAISEINLWFKPDEILEWHRLSDRWIYDIPG
jgi:nucleoside-diphosphate kinase